MRVRLKQDQLLELLARSNLSQNHWAIKLGLSRGHWSNLVNGKHPYPSARTRERMLEVLELEFDDLFEIEAAPAEGEDQDFRASISDRYMIDREIGRGGMGIVYLARDVRLGRSVAVKVVSPEAVSGIGAAQFLKEIRYAARLQHPHILPVHDADEAAGYPFYVTPYIEGGSLRERLKTEGRMGLDAAVPIVSGIAAALQYAHERRVLHCDVKPENILLAGDHAYVADFGISRAIHAEAFEWGTPPQIDSSAGTPAYVSPEHASGEQHLDTRSDLYSLGCMVFEMLSGRPPFTGTTTMQIVAQRFTSVVPDLHAEAPELPDGVSTSVGRAMALPANRRHASVNEFAAELRASAAGTRHLGLEVLRRRVARVRQSVSDRLFPSRPSANRKSTPMWQSIVYDLKYALRTLRRSPGFTAVVLLTLGFGIAVNSLVFSLFNPYFVRPLPFDDADRLVQLGHVDPVTGFDQTRFSLAQIDDFRRGANAFAGLGAYTYGSVNVTGDEGAVQLTEAEMSGNLFDLLGTDPRLGRTFSTDGPAAPAVVILSEGLWQRRFGSDPGVLGRTLTLDGQAHEVIGVMPAAFGFPFNEVELWRPITGDPVQDDRDDNWYLPVGRLQEGWSTEQAVQELNGIHANLARAYPEVDGRYSAINVESMREALNFAYDVLRVMFVILLAAVAFALLIAAVNVASLSLARTTGRTGEVAVRTSLGATRGRVVQQLLSESFVLAVGGGVIGVAVAMAGARVVGPVLPASLFRVGEMSVDGAVLGYTALITLITPVVFGLMPALTATRIDLATALKEGGRGGWGRGSMRARRLLVVFEVAMAVVLMSGMGLMARSFLAIQRVELGFVTDPILTASATPPALAYESTTEVRGYFARAADAIRAVPGVREVALTGVLPLNHEDWTVQFARPGRVPPTPEDWPLALQYAVSPEYFDVMDVRTIQGRVFDSGDREDGALVIIVNRALVDAMWPNTDPIGQTLLYGDPAEPRTASVIGVVENTKHEGLDGPDRPQIYRSHAQAFSRRQFLVIATERTPETVIASVRTALEGVDANVPLTIRPMNEIVAENTLQWSVSSVLLGVLGTASLILASLGIYGVIAYSVAQRRREIGIRMALGADDRRIRSVFLGEGIRLGATGLVIGLLGSLGVGQLIASQLFGVPAVDPLTFGGVALVFAMVAGAASVLPALRACRVNPVGALRE